MSYGELYIPLVSDRVNKMTGRYMKGHVPANKGKRWSEWMTKRGQKRSAKGWKNVELHRPTKRDDIAGRMRKQVVNTDHRYKGIRWYFESDDVWTEKIMQS